MRETTATTKYNSRICEFRKLASAQVNYHNVLSEPPTLSVSKAILDPLGAQTGSKFLMVPFVSWSTLEPSEFII